MPRTTARAKRIAVVFAFLISIVAALAQNGVVRLRNEHIETPEKAQRRATMKSQPEATARTGLFLLQFEGPLQPAWSAELQQRGVTLVRYVPNHAFIARASGVKLRDLEDLPYVRWTGAFRPEHKILGGLQNQKGAAAGDVAVSVLLATDSSPQQLAGARGLMKKLSSESPSRFGHVWRGEIPHAQLTALAASDAVLWIERAPQIKLNDETASKIVGGESGSHATYVQSLGYDGHGVVVSVADSGLHYGDVSVMHPDLLGRVDALLFYGALTDASDEHGHGTHVTGIIAGNGATGEFDDFGALWGLGVAPGAHVIMQRIFDGAGNFEAPPSFLDLTRDAVQSGADIGSNSWGDDTQGRYDISAAEFDALVRDADGAGHPYILEFSAGNAGPGAQTVGSPAVAKNVIAPGAAQNDRFDFFIYDQGRDAMADFSSRGPCEDGRIKPDVTAPGTWISSLRSPVGNDEFAWGDISYYYMFEGGTSQAGPHVSGAAAVFVQWYRESHTNATPSPALVKAALINSAVDMDNTVETGPTPNMDEGWGRVDLTEIIGSPRIFDFVDQAITLSTGQQYEWHIAVLDSGEPLKITLSYTDVPGFPGALAALVNDLDLEVIAPDGTTYHGNQFENGESIPDAPGFDSINNVEAVHIFVPQPGEYIVRVRARNVPSDARVDTGAVDQDFALVASALILPPGEGIVFLDRPAYTAPSRIKIKVIDTSLSVAATPSVTLKSATETNGFAVTLKYAGYPGSFTGSVATATGAAANDGKFQIAHGNWIRVEYLDASAGVIRTANAVADLLPPVITSVADANEYGDAVISWFTDEPASSVVRFSTNTTLNFVITDNFLVTEHSVMLTNLLPGRTYKFTVSCTDSAGNTSTNNNGGALFSFTAPTNATVLLVNGYTYVSGSAGENIPLSSYTNALRAAGISYDVASTTNLGISRLLPYPVVMWRINDAYDSSDTLTATQRNLITQYITNGGSFFMSSMDILTRLIDNGGANFVTNVLHVSRFTRNDILNPCPTCDEDHTVPTAEGIPSDPISDELLVDLDYSHYPEIDLTFEVFGPDFADTFGVKRDAAAAWTDFTSGLPAGMHFPRTGQDSTGRVVFFSFPFDAIPESGSNGNQRATVVRRVMQFLIPGLDGIGSIALDRDEYAIPDAVTIEVADLDLAGTNQIAVNVFSDSVTNRIPITLTETMHRGLFRGIVTLTNLAAAPAPGRLRANNGDFIHALYFDASGNITISATAQVDSTTPTISGVKAVPDYESVTVTWTTSEETDALVEFGESPFFGRTAYIEEISTAHEIVLTGLVPDQLYYYRVISRDPAGNTAVDDNGGTNYTVRTLVPLTPPFVDHFDAGANLWTVFNGDTTQTQWTLGVPNNALATAAYSPPNAWGSSLSNNYGSSAAIRRGSNSGTSTTSAIKLPRI